VTGRAWGELNNTAALRAPPSPPSASARPAPGQLQSGTSTSASASASTSTIGRVRRRGHRLRGAGHGRARRTKCEEWTNGGPTSAAADACGCAPHALAVYVCERVCVSVCERMCASRCAGGVRRAASHDGHDRDGRFVIVAAVMCQRGRVLQARPGARIPGRPGDGRPTLANKPINGEHLLARSFPPSPLPIIAPSQHPINFCPHSRSRSGPRPGPRPSRVCHCTTQSSWTAPTNPPEARCEQPPGTHTRSRTRSHRRATAPKRDRPLLRPSGEKTQVRRPPFS
jgi:hypothetical protein